MSIEKTKVYNVLNLLITCLIILLAVIPTLEILLRLIFKGGVPGSYGLIRHIVLWITFIGSYFASVNGEHLAIDVGKKYVPKRFQPTVIVFAKVVEIAILISFFFASVAFIYIAFGSSEKIGIFSIRFLAAIMPVCFLAMASFSVRSVFIKSEDNNYVSRPVLIISVVFALLIGILFSIFPIVNTSIIFTDNYSDFMMSLLDIAVNVARVIQTPLVIVLIIAGVFGAPIFIVLGGITYILLSASGGYTAIAVNEVYSVLTGNMIPSIPLFTIAGFILSESKSGERMIEFFKKAVGWFPGGIIIAAVVISAFFTTFTGASGVTILALGGILYVILEKYGVDEKFNTGILTSSGSIGLLFPPSLPIILYGITSGLDIKYLFIAGILPGTLLVLSLSVLGVIYAKKHKIKSEKFVLSEIFSSAKSIFWELLLPFIILFSYFFGFTTIVETGAVAVVYLLIIETFVYRELKLSSLLTVVKKSIPVIGGILIILGMSKALSFYMVDEQIPQRLSQWISERITSKIVFLLLLNIVLLLTGCIMDIFSAIVVIAPLIIPLGEVYGIHPVHLGIIFLANLELGYLTPPVGLNLFLASYRFEKPIEKVYSSIVPFFLIMLIAVIIITFVPQISLLFL